MSKERIQEENNLVYLYKKQKKIWREDATEQGKNQDAKDLWKNLLGSKANQEGLAVVRPEYDYVRLSTYRCSDNTVSFREMAENSTAKDFGVVPFPEVLWDTAVKKSTLISSKWTFALTDFISLANWVNNRAQISDCIPL